MHAEEVQVTPATVRQLIAGQFPKWAHLPVRPVTSTGTDNLLYRLGDDMAVRLPRVPWAAGQVAKECRWLPELAPSLPLATPTPLGLGEPAEGYPWQWSVVRWIDGDVVTPERLEHFFDAARALGAFVRALHDLPAEKGPAAGEHNSGRGVPLATRDDAVRTAIAALAGEIDGRAALRTWERAVAARRWQGPPVWIHGDLQPGNLLARDGALIAVIDFGCLGVGDPACDLMVAWNLFPDEARRYYREAVRTDDDTWLRGRGWALSVALVALPYYRDTNPALAALARHTLAALLADAD